MSGRAPGRPVSSNIRPLITHSPEPVCPQGGVPLLDIAIVEAVRTPFVKAFGPLAGVPAHELGRLATRALLDRAAVRPEQVDQVVFGNVALPPEAANPARV